MKEWLLKITGTNGGLGVSLLRIVVGLVFFKEGTGKLFGWFGGGGWAATCAYFQNLGIPFPELNAFLVGYTEFLGGTALVLGLLTRLAALPIGITMIVALLTAHRGGPYHYPLLILAVCMALLEAGSGRLSLDRLLSKPKGLKTA
jgi:putative oxidoreductase